MQILEVTGKQFRKAHCVIFRDGLNAGILHMNSVPSSQRGAGAGHFLQIVHAIERNKRAVVQVVCAARETIAHANSKPADAVQAEWLIQKRIKLR